MLEKSVMQEEKPISYTFPLVVENEKHTVGVTITPRPASAIGGENTLIEIYCLNSWKMRVYESRQYIYGSLKDLETAAKTKDWFPKLIVEIIKIVTPALSEFKTFTGKN